MALTATAPEVVQKDIFKTLGLSATGRTAYDRCAIFKQPYNRPNLFFEVREKVRDRETAKADILELLQDPQSGCHNVCGIIYCMTHKDTESLADYLNDHGIVSDYYHAGK